MNSIVSVPACLPNPGIFGQVCCKLSWPILLHSYQINICTLIFSSSFAVDVVCYWLHCDCIFLESVQTRYSVPICVFIVSATSILNILGAFLNVFTWLNILVLDLVLYLCVPVLSILMSLLAVFTLPGSHGSAALVYPFYFQFSFCQFSYFWCNC